MATITTTMNKMMSPTAAFPIGFLHVSTTHLLTFSVHVVSDTITGGSRVLLYTTDVDKVELNVIVLDGLGVGVANPVKRVLTL